MMRAEHASLVDMFAVESRGNVVVMDLVDLATRVRSRATNRDQTAAVEAYRAWLQR